MDKPVAYLITWTTYGTWLHGDARGSFDSDGNYIPQDERRRAAAQGAMVDTPVTLTPEQRGAMDKVIVDHCRIRSWVLHTRNVRTQHVHVVVSSPIDGENVREELKAWGSRRLSELAGIPPAARKDGARKWWTEKGNIEPIWNDRQLEAAIRYVNDQ